MTSKLEHAMALFLETDQNPSVLFDAIMWAKYGDSEEGCPWWFTVRDRRTSMSDHSVPVPIVGLNSSDGEMERAWAAAADNVHAATQDLNRVRKIANLRAYARTKQ